MWRKKRDSICRKSYALFKKQQSCLSGLLFLHEAISLPKVNGAQWTWALLCLSNHLRCIQFKKAQFWEHAHVWTFGLNFKLVVLSDVSWHLPLRSSMTKPGGWSLTGGLGFNLAGSKCLGGGPAFGGKKACLWPTPMGVVSGLGGEWLPTLEPPWPESVVFIVTSNSLARRSVSSSEVGGFEYYEKQGRAWDMKEQIQMNRAKLIIAYLQFNGSHKLLVKKIPKEVCAKWIHKNFLMQIGLIWREEENVLSSFMPRTFDRFVITLAYFGLNVS